MNGHFCFHISFNSATSVKFLLQLLSVFPPSFCSFYNINYQNNPLSLSFSLFSFISTLSLSPNISTRTLSHSHTQFCHTYPLLLWYIVYPHTISQSQKSPSLSLYLNDISSLYPCTISLLTPIPSLSIYTFKISVSISPPYRYTSFTLSFFINFIKEFWVYLKTPKCSLFISSVASVAHGCVTTAVQVCAYQFYGLAI